MTLESRQRARRAAIKHRMNRFEAEKKMKRSRARLSRQVLSSRYKAQQARRKAALAGERARRRRK
jgi:hypothetical protein